MGAERRIDTLRQWELQTLLKTVGLCMREEALAAHWPTLAAHWPSHH